MAAMLQMPVILSFNIYEQVGATTQLSSSVYGFQSLDVNLTGTNGAVSAV